MYSPPHYQYSDEELLTEVSEQNPFATMISPDFTISHLPLYLRERVLMGHMARANSHWQIADGKEVISLFHGPDAYISPAWYSPSPANVPTWNYVTVHVRGKFQVVDDEQRGFELLKEQVIRNEAKTGWKLPSSSGEIQRLFKAITVFEIVDLQLEGKFKLSQKHDEVNKKNVIAELEKGSEEARKVAAYMQRLSLN